MHAILNKSKWLNFERNSDFIKNDIGLDLYTGIKIKDNSYIAVKA